MPKLLLFVILPIIFIMNAIKIVCWNCRGISVRDTSNLVLRLIQNYKVMMLCLSETRLMRIGSIGFATSFLLPGAGLRFWRIGILEESWSLGGNPFVLSLQLPSLVELSILLFP